MITGGTVVDGTGGPAAPGTDVLVDGDRIVAVGAGVAAGAPPEAVTIDATGCTVMPGLIDAHCHVTFGEPASNDELFSHRPASTSMLLAAFNVPKLLRAGVTGFLDADCIADLRADCNADHRSDPPADPRADPNSISSAQPESTNV